MRKFFNILWGVLAVLYSVMYVQHVSSVKRAEEFRSTAKYPPFMAQVDMSIDGVSIYSARGFFFCQKDECIFRLSEIGAKGNLQALARHYAGKKVKLTFRTEQSLLKEGYATVPHELNGFFIIYHETHVPGTDDGELSATDELSYSDSP